MINNLLYPVLYFSLFAIFVSLVGGVVTGISLKKMSELFILSQYIGKHAHCYGWKSSVTQTRILCIMDRTVVPIAVN
jgi:hypothetical protein